MEFVEKEKFEGTVQGAAFVTSPEKGTPGFSLIVATGAGPIDRTWWLSENSVGFLQETLDKTFGITEQQLQNDQFIEGGVSDFLKGRPCSVVPELAKDANGNVWRDKEGKTRWTIQWLNPSRLGKKATGESVGKISRLFGSTVSRPRGGSDQEPPPPAWGADGITDENPPF